MKTKKFLSVFFAFMMLFSAACGDNNATPSNGYQEPENVGTPVDTSPVVEGKYVVKDGATDYAILIPDAAASTVEVAATELAYFFNYATGINLETKTNSEYSADKKYISIGNTEASETVTVTAEELGTQGFKIVTVGDNIVIKAVGNHGLLWGAYELMTRMFNYEYYAKDVFQIDTDVKEYPLKNYAITDRPDVEVRAVADSQGYSNSEVAHRMRQFQVYDEFLIPMHNNYHNSYYYVMDGVDKNNKPIVPAEFIGTCGTQLCFTGGGVTEVYEDMLTRACNYLTGLIEKSDKSDAIIGVMDENGWCNCASCQTVITKYGAKSATMILFMNDLREKLDAWLETANIGRDINLYYTSYFDIVNPPVVKNANGEYVPTHEDMVLKDGVGILFAPINSDYTQSIYAEKNAATYEQLKMMKAITKKLLVWTYACNFYDFFLPYDSTTYMVDWVKEIVANNGTYWFNQGMHSQGNSSQFDAVRQYLVAKLGWDTDADVERLINNFFNVYFGVARQPMRKMYDELRTVMRYNSDVLGMSAGVVQYVTKEEFFPEQLLNHWMELIEEAYKLAGDDKALHDRILRESIFVRYYLIKFYQSDADNIAELKQQFISDAMKVGIEKSSEHKAINKAFD